MSGYFPILARHKSKAVICREIGKVSGKKPWTSQKAAILLEAQSSPDTDRTEDYGVNNIAILRKPPKSCSTDYISSKAKADKCSIPLDGLAIIG